MVQVADEQPRQRPEQGDSPLLITVLLLSLVLITGVGMVMKIKDPAHFQNWVTLLGVISTLAIFSILYKENPLFRFVEHIFIGLAAGYAIAFYWAQYIYPDWFVPMMPKAVVAGGQGQWWHILELLFGLLFFTVYFPKISWMNRFALGVLMGWAAGFVFRGFVSMYGPMITKSFKSPVTFYTPEGVSAGGAHFDPNNIHLFGDVWIHPWAIVFFVVLICTLTYFFFSVEHRTKLVRQPAVAGRYFIMITLGAIFGTTVMGRFSLVIERLDFLLKAFQGWFHAIF